MHADRAGVRTYNWRTLVYRFGFDGLYSAAKLVKDEGFLSDGSIFSPGADIWNLANALQLRSLFVGRPDYSKRRRFDEKLLRQLRKAPDSVIQLSAELLFVYLWIVSPTEMSGAKKSELVRNVLDQADAHASYAGVETGMTIAYVRLSIGASHRLTGSGAKPNIFTWSAALQIPIK
jgi:hypothetical protein